MDYFDPKTLEVFWQLTLAVLLGLVIGAEREMANKSAGMRTHALVAMGSALFSILSVSISIGSPDSDPARIAAQIVTGVGFLGAGIIIFHKSRIQGLTTAAGVWVAAAIGMAVGFGYEKIAMFATLLTVLIFIVLYPIEVKLRKIIGKE